MFNQNQIGATINLFLIDLIDGKVTEDEKAHMRRYLLNIMRNAPSPYRGLNKEDNSLKKDGTQQDSSSEMEIPKTR
ncbi:hypothetical protein [Nitrososphaera sp. AFS]|uniref:hypothetical protein n=1 Tax=Nitrososphaera sp. AFS TaxID=2301191 RepID=UPI001917496E|nr:hypothetical protein [Nitrososphaera sp. AFS]